ncbi:MAG: CBS domain-containing protein [Candidatus Omnitrophica bacterium]|nr:CBS domain-containing protein [Candidatus Omnitrophota bacterium]
MIYAKDLMTKTAIVVPDDMQVTDLVKILRDKRIGGVPVMNKDRKIIGIVTVTDVFNAMKIVRRMNRQKAAWLSLFTVGRKAILVKEIFSRKVISVLPDSPIEKVVELMMEKDIHTIPVMNEDQTILYGVVGRHDVTWAAFGDVVKQPDPEGKTEISESHG